MHEDPQLQPAPDLYHAADVELVRRCLEGVSEAKQEVLERLTCVPRYLATANRKAGHPLEPQDLSDLSQDMLILIWRKIATYEGRARLEYWAFSYCRFGFWNRARKHNQQKRMFSADLDSIAESYAGEADAPEAMDYSRLEDAMKGLPAPERTVIQLKHFEGLKFREISERLQISPNTVKGRYYRGLKELKTRLDAASREDS